MPRRSDRYARRDNYVSKVANAVLRLASHEYQQDVNASIQYGLDSFRRDAIQGLAPPIPGKDYGSSLLDVSRLRGATKS